MTLKIIAKFIANFERLAIQIYTVYNFQNLESYFPLERHISLNVAKTEAILYYIYIHKYDMTRIMALYRITILYTVVTDRLKNLL